MDEDFISKLPEDILLLIISHTPTRIAITTSILSKRWRNVYKSMSIFDLDHRDLSRSNDHSHCCDLIVRRLERLLRLCSDSKIRSFKLKCCRWRKLDHEKFKQCIYHLGKSGIENLTVELSCCERSNYCSLPSNFLLDLPSLKEITLIYCSPKPNINTEFYSLHTLCLFRCTIVDCFLECILSNCLSVQSLTISFCECPRRLRFGPDIRLKDLVIQLGDVFSEIELYAENLSKFEFLSMHRALFDFGYLPRLETVCLCTEEVTIMPKVFTELPNFAPAIKFLTFCIGGEFFQERPCPGMITFGDLRRLDIIFHCNSSTDLQELTPYLESCPCLEELHLNLSGMHPWVAVQSKPITILHKKLKRVEMSGFDATENEIKFAVYILKSATALEHMYITRCLEYYIGHDEWWRSTREPWIEEILQYIKQTLCDQAHSATAKLIFRHQSSFTCHGT